VNRTAEFRGGRGAGALRAARFRRGPDLAIDLGTANTVVFRRGEGVVLFEPSVVAMDEQSGRVYAVGEEARLMLGRTPATITATRPLRHGVITDFETTEQMLRQFVRRVTGRRRPGLVVICVPSGLTQVERSAVVEATLAAGAREAHLIEEALAAAIGAGLPVADAVGSLVLDVGGGTSEVAVTALAGIVVARSLQVGGYDLDDAIVRLLQHEHKLLVGQEQAEQVKLEIGAAVEAAGSRATADVGGRDLVTGLLRRATLGTDEVREALQRPLAQIVDALKELLEQTPAELSADVAATGVMLVGGGALLPGFDALIRRETGLPVVLDHEPLTTVARGAGAALEEAGTSTGRRRAGPRLSR
jgi:rod shape-determining protein MreB and related proteins